MNLYRALLPGIERFDESEKLFGVVVAVVTNNQDPDGAGRVKVKFPWLSDADESHWARIAVSMAGKEMGVYFLPEVNDEVLVAFEHGDERHPYVVGSLWNGEEKPPETNADGNNNIRLIKSRSGHVIRFNDEAGAETLEIIDKSGKNSVTLNVAENTISIAAEKDIVLKAPKGKIRLEAQELEIEASANAKVEAAGEMTLKGARVNIN